MSHCHDTHPLMPGIRCAEIQQPDWPRTLHDKQLTGFSPLSLGMTCAPDIWQMIDLPGEYRWIETVDTATGPGFLVDDGRLSLYDISGDDPGHPHTGPSARSWCTPISGRLVFWGDLFGTGRAAALIRQTNRLWVIDGATGEILWHQSYEPPHVDLRVCVGAVLPGTAGQQAAVFEQYGESGWLLSFESDGSVREVWRRQVIANDVWPVRADHGCDVAFDLESERPILWNVRHHRCQSFEVETGEPIGCVQYELEGAFRRNYGPWQIATGAGGQRAIAVASEMVQTHVHGLHLHEDGTPELAWDRYYGEVYVVPGVAVEFLGVHDVDGDGAEEIVYNVRDPEQAFRSFVRARDVATGEIRYEWADRWCSALARTGIDDRTLLALHPAPSGATPEQGMLQLVSVSAGVEQVLGSFDHAGPWGPAAVPGAQGKDLILRVVDDHEAAIVRFDGTTLEEMDRAQVASELTRPFGASARIGKDLVLGTVSGALSWPRGRVGSNPAEIEGSTRPASAGPPVELDSASPKSASLGSAGLDLSGLAGGHPYTTLDELFRFDLTGGAPPTMSAAILGEDDAADLFAHIPGQRVQRFDLRHGEPDLLADEPFLGDLVRHSPLLYDLDGDGVLELVIPGASPRGELTVRATRPDGTTCGTDLWAVVLPDARTDDEGKVIAWNAGHFLPAERGARAAVAITVYSSRRVQEGTYLLDGVDGNIEWFRGIYHDGDVIRAYRPVGLPGVFDWDDDGVEEIAWDMYSYMAFLRGDGELAAIFGGPNVRPEGEAVPAISLYNGFTPVYRGDDERPHWFIHHGHDRFGLVGPDPRQGVWHEEVGYDTPDRIGFVDVDGDGVLEVGYALRNDRTFRCRDLWTGKTKWTLDLPAPLSGPVITADVDGDGRGEFLVDRWCIGTDGDGQGEIRWTSPVPFGWAVMADFDGDGMGEIACSNSGRITILKAR